MKSQSSSPSNHASSFSSSVHVHFPDQERNNELLFTLSGVNVTIANAIRRTILADINTVVFNTKEYKDPKLNHCQIYENTTRLNNELIKQRLSCIPIHITDVKEFDINQHYLQIREENTDDTVFYVTTEHFQIINKERKEPISKEMRDKIFPSSRHLEHEWYIDFVRLRPRIGDAPTERLFLTCNFSIGNAKEDGMYNVVSTCAYKYTVDKEKQQRELETLKELWANEGKTHEQIEFEEKNWKLLEGVRVPYTKPNSFDFIIESVGVFEPENLVIKACNIINRKLDSLIQQEDIFIRSLEKQTTIENCFEIVLKNDDYTIGKIIEYMMYSLFYEGENNLLSFCGFKKLHPHDPDSYIQIAFKNNVTESSMSSVIRSKIQDCAIGAIEIFCKIKEEFKSRSGRK